MIRAAGRLRLVAATLSLVAAAGCTAGSTHTPAQPPAPLRLDASVAQFRFDEGTHRLKAAVTNQGKQDIRVSQATIAWDGLAFPTVPITDPPVPPGLSAAFTITYGKAQCAQPPATKPVLLTVVDGRPRRVPLRVEDPGLLDRLHAKACAEQRLGRAAGVDLRLSRRTVRVAGEEYVPGAIVVRHRDGATKQVRIVDLGGSVLVDLLPRAGRRALPGTLRRDRRSLAFPVLIGSAHRCDAHALSQSSQTFLISAYLRLGDRPTQREVLPLTSAERDRITGVIHRDCA